MKIGAPRLLKGRGAPIFRKKRENRNFVPKNAKKDGRKIVKIIEKGLKFSEKPL